MCACHLRRGPEPEHRDPGRVLVSRTVKDLVAGSGLEFTAHGVHELKGIAGDWELVFCQLSCGGRYVVRFCPVQAARAR